MTNEQYIRKNALIYQRYKDNFDQLTYQDIEDFRSDICKAWLKIPVNVQWVDRQPYQTHQELSEDIRTHKIMKISRDFNDSKLLPGDLNLMFRAIHDYLHYTLQAPFTATGEIKVFHLQKKFHPTEVGRKILFSEVVLQACYAEYFKEFSPTQKVILL